MLSEAVTVNNLFPLAFKEHLIFGIVGVVFFLFQYYRLRRSYQAVMAIAIATTFFVYLGESAHNIIGLAELVLMILVVISLIKDSIEEKKKKKSGEDKQITENIENISEENTQDKPSENEIAE